MQASGFVLAGGASKRMGQDKALLPYHGTTLVEHVAKTVSEAAGTVALIGDPARLGHLGLAVFPDELPGCGPASGIYTALRVTETDWNLVLACDMPAVSADILRQLLRRAETFGAQLRGRDRTLWPTGTAVRRLPSALLAGTDPRNSR